MYLRCFRSPHQGPHQGQVSFKPLEAPKCGASLHSCDSQLSDITRIINYCQQKPTGRSLFTPVLFYLSVIKT